MTKLDFNPGDLIEWVYKCNNELAVENEILWSSIEKCYIPIGRELVHLCISVDDETYSWLNEEGLFCACVDDLRATSTPDRGMPVVPRIRK